MALMRARLAWLWEKSDRRFNLQVANFVWETILKLVKVADGASFGWSYRCHRL